MNITAAQLIQAGAGPTQAKAFAAPLGMACAMHGIDTPKRVAAFVAQCLHESANLTALEEHLFYKTPERVRVIWPTRIPSLAAAAELCGKPERLANRVYAGRNGNGDEASGDGWRFRGRGLIQITGRDNYRAVGFEDRPEALAQPVEACMSAAAWWAAHGLNAGADADRFDAITRAINGAAMAGAADRRATYSAALAAFTTENP